MAAPERAQLSRAMPTHVSTEPTARMGVYTRLTDVPAQYRLTQFEADYAGRDTWHAYVDARPASFDSEHYRNTLTKAGRSWKTHMTDRGRHHALATPADVAAWVDALVATRTHWTVYKEYWVRLEEFYTWLQSHPAHPHVYHPPLMAVVAGGTPERLWRQKFGPDTVTTALSTDSDESGGEQ